MTKPFYKLEESKFEIDNCLPQLNAVKSNKIEMHAITHGDYPGKVISANQLPGVSSMGFLQIIEDQDWGIEPHRNEGIEICYQETGTNRLMVSGNKYTIPPRSVTITRPWQQHQVGDPNISVGRLHWLILDVGVRRPNQHWKWPTWCILTEADKTELENRLRGNEHPVWQANKEIGKIFRNLQTYIINEQFAPHLSHVILNLNHLLLTLLDLLRAQNRLCETTMNPQGRVVEIFLQELLHEAPIASFEWTLDLMAEHCGMGRSAFSNYCQQLTNMSPIKYLTRSRLHHATELMLAADFRSFTNLALDLGFSTSQYFSRCFKNQYGVSPKEWQRLNQ